MSKITKQHISDKIAREHGVAFFSLGEHAAAKEFHETCLGMGFGSSCDWSASTGGIDIGAWHVRVWSRDAGTHND
jgi:hypothetical protein